MVIHRDHFFEECCENSVFLSLSVCHTKRSCIYIVTTNIKILFCYIPLKPGALPKIDLKFGKFRELLATTVEERPENYSTLGNTRIMTDVTKLSNNYVNESEHNEIGIQCSPSVGNVSTQTEESYIIPEAEALTNLYTQYEIEQIDNAENDFGCEESEFLLGYEESELHFTEFGRYSWVIVSVTCLFDFLKM